MSDYISQLWYGNIAPSDQCGVNDREVKRLETLMLHYYEKLEEGAAENTKALLDKYAEYVFDYVSAYCRRAFCDGYCTGARITAESLLGSEKMLH